MISNPEKTSEQTRLASNKEEGRESKEMECKVKVQEGKEDKLTGKSDREEENEEDNREEATARQDSGRKGTKKLKRQKTTNKETPREKFKPCINKMVYVPWQSFELSKALPWSLEDTSETSVVGIYTKETDAGWKVFFPALKQPSLTSSWDLEDNWVQRYGHLTTPSQKVLSHKDIKEGLNDPHRTIISSLAQEDADEQLIYEEECNNITDSPLHPNDSETSAQFGDEILHIPKGSMGVATLNVNSLESGRTVPAVDWIMRHRGIGIVATQDTRVEKQHHNFVRSKWTQQRPNGQMLLFGNNKTVGGQAIFLNPEWTRRRLKQWEDPSQLAIICEATFQGSHGTIRLISIYWPCTSKREDSQGLESQLRRWLLVHRPGMSSEDYLWSIIKSRLKKPAQTVILVGDFNKHWTDEFQCEIEDLGLLNAHESENFSSRYAGTRATGTIDYILTEATVVRAGNEDKLEWSTISDHRPIWAWVQTETDTITTKVRKRQIQYRPTSRTANEGKELEYFQRGMAEFIKSKPSIPLVKLVKHAVHAHRIPVKGNLSPWWTPWYGAMCRWIRMLQKIKIAKTLPQVTELIESTKAATIAMGVDGEDAWEEIENEVDLRSTFGIKQLWLVPGLRAHMLQLEIRKAYNLMHGRKRKERWKSQMETVAKRKKDKYLYYKHFGVPRRQLQWDQARIGKRVIRNPSEIQKALVNKFRKTYAAKKQYASCLWEKCHEYTSFSLLLGNAHVPTPLTKTIHKALYSTLAKRDKIEKFLTRKATTPSLEEFINAIKESNDHSAGGPSGLTYKILKDLPLAVKEHCYNDLLKQWDSGSFEDWLSKKHLYPIEKKPLTYTDLDNLRPIMLLEVLRKIWLKIVSQKMRATWERAGILQSTQFGFRAGRSCTSGVLTLRNAIEEAKDTGNPLFGSSWDIKAAFDSVSRQLMELALQRLGVASDLASFLTRVDAKDEIDIKIPAFADHPKSATFRSEIGAPQGDSPSPTLWNAFFDILLTALSIHAENDFYFRTADGDLISTGISAYADDILTLAGTPSTIQKQADIISAFGATFDMEFSHEKFRSFNINGESTASVTLHNGEWTPVTINFNAKHFLKYLGATIDTDGGSSEEKKALQRIVAEGLSRFAKKADTAEHHLSYLATGIGPALTYKAQFANLPQGTLEKMGTSLRAHAKDTSHLPSSFPHAVLEGPREEGGMGYQNLQTASTLAKIRIIETALRSKGEHHLRTAIEGILGREFQRQHLTLTEERAALRTADGPPSWLQEVLVFLAAMDVQLIRRSSYHTNKLDVNIPTTLRKQLPANWEVHKIGDLYRWTNDSWSIIDPARQAATALLPRLPLISNKETLYFSPGQTWLWEEKEQTGAIIIDGWTSSAVRVEWWPTKHRYTHTTRLPIQTRRLGYKWILWENFNPSKKVILTKDVGNQRGIRDIHSATGNRRKDIRETVTTPKLPVHKRDFICTDGSWEEASDTFGRGNPVAAAAIIEVDGSSPPFRPSIRKATRITNFANDSPERAYAQEAIAACLTVATTAIPTYSDCQTVVLDLKEEFSSKNKLIDLTKQGTRNPLLFHIRAHPERRTPPASWTMHEWGNHYADAVAGGKSPEGTQVEELSGLEASLQILKTRPAWVFWTPNGLLFDKIKNQVNKKKMHSYLQLKTGALCWDPQLFKYGQLAYGSTVRQRAATVKLALARYDRDRQGRAGTLPPCRCGCRNVLEDWTTTCQRHDIRATLQQARDKITKIGGEDTGLITLIGQLLDDPSGIALWRGIWQPGQANTVDNFLRSRPTRNQQDERKKIKEITGTLIQHALTLHGIASGKKLAPKEKEKVSRTKRKRERLVKANKLLQWLGSTPRRSVSSPPPSRRQRTKEYLIIGSNRTMEDYYNRKGEGEP